MIIKATQKYTRQAPRKVRLVANSLKKMSVVQAIHQLGVIERRASIVVMKVMRQAIANALNNHGLSLNDLSVRSVQVTDGPYYKRFRAASRGRAHSIYKRTSHVVVELETVSAAQPVVAIPETEVKTEKTVVAKSTKSIKKSKKSQPKAEDKE